MLSNGLEITSVTLFGKTFGTIAVGLHLIAWGGEQEHFSHTGILALVGIGGERDDTAVKANTALLVEKLECPTKNGIVEAGALACLRNVPLTDLAKANVDVARKRRPPHGFKAFAPVVDEDFIPKSPERLLEEGRFMKYEKQVPSPRLESLKSLSRYPSGYYLDMAVSC